jgi:hypothetical protein
MPSTGLSDRIRRFLSWDPLNTDWKHIAFIARGTEKSAKELQASLKTGNTEDRAEALAAHASNIADYLINVPTKDVPELVWWIAKVVVSAEDAFPPELLDIVRESAPNVPYAYASFRRKLVVNTLTNAGSQLL